MARKGIEKLRCAKERRNLRGYVGAELFGRTAQVIYQCRPTVDDGDVTRKSPFPRPLNASSQPAVNHLSVQEIFLAHEASIRPVTISKEWRRAAWSYMLLVNINSSAPVFSTNARIPSATTPGEPIAEHDSI